jgi:hypothetical protein
MRARPATEGATGPAPDGGRIGADDQQPGAEPTRHDGPAAAAAALADDEAASDHYARQLAETSGAAFLYGSLAGVFQQAGTAAFKKYRDRLVADCGDPADPVEIMLIEQLALAHLNAGRLHYRAAVAEGVEAARAFGGLAVLLHGEVRCTALALQEYRARARCLGAEARPAGVVGPVAAGAQAPAEKARRRRTG